VIRDDDQQGRELESKETDRRKCWCGGVVRWPVKRIEPSCRTRKGLPRARWAQDREASSGVEGRLEAKARSAIISEIGLLKLEAQRSGWRLSGGKPATARHCLLRGRDWLKATMS
jgi:hypothetical protein